MSFTLFQSIETKKNKTKQKAPHSTIVGLFNDTLTVGTANYLSIWILAGVKRTKIYLGFNINFNIHHQYILNLFISLTYLRSWIVPDKKNRLSPKEETNKKHIICCYCINALMFWLILVLISNSDNLMLFFLLALFLIDLQWSKQITDVSLYYNSVFFFFLQILKTLVPLLIYQGIKITKRETNKAATFAKKEV